MEMQNGSKLEAMKEFMQGKRFAGIKRDYHAEDILRVAGSIENEYTVARRMSRRLWKSLQDDPFVRTFGALNGMQAVQMVRAGIKAIYVSGWQTAAANNLRRKTFPDRSIYPVDSVPAVVEDIVQALEQQDRFNRSRTIRRTTSTAMITS
jgi:isocitrate lyase